MRARGAALAPIALLVAATASHAASIPISNASFEDPAQSTMGTFELLTPPGWSLYDPGGITGAESDLGVWWPNLFFDYVNGAQDGNQVGFVFLDYPIGTGVAGMTQTLSAALQPNTRYSFEVYVGDPTDDSDPLLAGFPGYRVELVAGGERIVDDDDTATQEGQLRSAIATIPVGSAHPGLGQPLAIRLLNRNAAVGTEVDFDLVSVDATPGQIETYEFTVSHVGGSLAGLLVYDRERSAATQNFGRDASLLITTATGDLAPFASIDTDGGLVNAAGTVLQVRASTGNFLLLLFGQALSLNAALPVAAFQSASSSVYLSNVAVVDAGEAGALFTIPEPASGAAVTAIVVLLARQRRNTSS